MLGAINFLHSRSLPHKSLQISHPVDPHSSDISICAVAVASLNFERFASQSGVSLFRAFCIAARHSAADIGAFAQVCNCNRRETAEHNISFSCGDGRADDAEPLLEPPPSCCCCCCVFRYEASTDERTEAVRSAALSRSSAQ